MSTQEWSDQIIVVDLANDPEYTDEITTLTERLVKNPKHVVLNFSRVGFLANF